MCKTSVKKTVAAICVIIVLSSVVTIGYLVLKPTSYYQTTNIEDYGVYIGNCNNQVPSSYIDSFFPEEILPEFVNVFYSYRAENADTYGYEAYLEFRIEDSQEFLDYVFSVASENEWKKFAFDDNYMEHPFDDKLQLSHREYTTETGTSYYHIQEAKIGKVLYSAKEQKIVFVAIGVFDGGGANTEFLNVYFDRFKIDPKEYASSLAG